MVSNEGMTLKAEGLQVSFWPLHPWHGCTDGSQKDFKPKEVQETRQSYRLRFNIAERYNNYKHLPINDNPSKCRMHKWTEVKGGTVPQLQVKTSLPTLNPAQNHQTAGEGRTAD